MNAFVKLIAATLVAATSAFAFAQTVATPIETTATVVATPSIDLPKELKGKWHGWGGGNRIARNVSITLTDVKNPNDIKGTISWEDRDCPAYSNHAPIEIFKFSGGLLSVDTPPPAECVRINPGEFPADSRLTLSLRLTRDGAAWSAKGKALRKSPTRVVADVEVILTSP